jgi:hypothetical protein
MSTYKRVLVAIASVLALALTLALHALATGRTGL